MKKTFKTLGKYEESIKNWAILKDCRSLKNCEDLINVSSNK